MATVIKYPNPGGLNGSDPERQVEAYRAAMSALRKADEALAALAPDGRDWPTLGKALIEAQAVHAQRRLDLQGLEVALMEEAMQWSDAAQ